jgi:hypothetical protein
MNQPRLEVIGHRPVAGVRFSAPKPPKRQPASAGGPQTNVRDAKRKRQNKATKQT